MDKEFFYQKYLDKVLSNKMLLDNTKLDKYFDIINMLVDLKLFPVSSKIKKGYEDVIFPIFIHKYHKYYNRNYPVTIYDKVKISYNCKFINLHILTKCPCCNRFHTLNHHVIVKHITENDVYYMNFLKCSYCKSKFRLPFAYNYNKSDVYIPGLISIGSLNTDIVKTNNVCPICTNMLELESTIFSIFKCTNCKSVFIVNDKYVDKQTKYSEYINNHILSYLLKRCELYDLTDVYSNSIKKMLK